MAVTHAPAGFTGTVDQIDEARRFALSGGGRFRVASSTDWALSASSSVNRTVNINAGMASACGVVDVTTAQDAVTFATNGGGTDRFDAVVATFDWSAMTITFRVIQGTSVPPVVVKTGTTVDTTKINWLPGFRYDAVLAIIRVRPGVTLLAPADLYDCRPYGAWNTLSVAQVVYRDVIDVDLFARVRDISTGLIWQWTGLAWAQQIANLATVFWPNSTVPGTGNIPSSVISASLNGSPYRVRITCNVLVQAQGAGVPEVQLFIDGAIQDRSRINGVTSASTTNFTGRVGRTFDVTDGHTMSIFARVDIPAGVTATTFTDSSHSWIQAEVVPT
jgi:hypothetical protein